MTRQPDTAILFPREEALLLWAESNEGEGPISFAGDSWMISCKPEGSVLHQDIRLHLRKVP